MIFLVPPAAALLFALVVLTVGDGPVVWWVTRLVLHGSCVAAAARAASAFRRGEHMWLAWAAIAAGYATAVLFALFWGPLSPFARPAEVVIAVDVAMNGCLVAGSLLFVFAWSRAGLTLDGGPLVGTGLVVAALALALGVNGDALRDAFAHLHGATPLDGWDELLSITGDAATFAASVPLLRMAFALRGSALAPTWLLLGFSSLSWVVYDRVYAFAEASPGSWMSVAHALMAAATAATACAAVAHRRTARGAAAGTLRRAA